MDVMEQMDAKISAFSKTDRLIYESIKKFPSVFSEESITSISDKTSFTKPALTRFAKKLGYSGFSEFQYAFHQALIEKKNNQNSETSAQAYGRLLKQVEESITEDQIRITVEHLKNASRVFLLGSNLSRIPADEMNIAMMVQPGIPASSPRIDEMPHTFKESDLIMIYSARQGTAFQNLMKNIRNSEKKPFMILVTCNSKHPLRHNFNEVIDLPSIPLSENTSVVLSDTFAFLMFNDIVTSRMK